MSNTNYHFAIAKSCSSPALVASKKDILANHMHVCFHVQRLDISHVDVSFACHFEESGERTLSGVAMYLVVT